MKSGTPAPETVDEYIALFAPETRQKLERLRALIRARAPEAVERISYRMPAYFHDGPLLYFAAFKEHIGLYALPSAIEAFASELGGYKTSKGTIQFPLDEDLPAGLIEKIVEYRLRENAERIVAPAKPRREARGSP
jgi:uncharacterized protein YdhG (YjbR/CyaY superfamily)